MCVCVGGGGRRARGGGPPPRTVEHQVRHAAQVGLAHLEHVDEAARRGDANLDAAFQVPNLRSLGHATVDARGLDLGTSAKLAAFLVNLHRELTGRRQDQHNRTVTLDARAGACRPPGPIPGAAARGQSREARSPPPPRPPTRLPPRLRPHRLQVGLRVDVDNGGKRVR